MKLIQDTDFSNDFTIGNDIKIRQQPNIFEITWFAANAEPGNSDNVVGRRYLAYGIGGFGLVHLDFKTKKSGYIQIANLPGNAPTPQRLIEVQHDTGSIWIDQGSRQIVANGLTPNKRHIVNIVGFFA